MQKGHARISATIEQIRQSTPNELNERLHLHMPDHVFRLMTFDEDDYANGNVTIFCFNFIPTHFFVDISQNSDMEIALQEIARLNPGLVWEKIEISHKEKEVENASLRKTQALRIISVPAREDVDNSGEKIRLTLLDIQFVYKTLRRREFQMGAIGMMSKGNPLLPCFISNGGLVFVHGNDHFGVCHINKRHGWFTDGSEWRREESGREFLDNPSKFAQTSVPIDDYRRIADDIYTPANKVISKYEDIFEKYSGISNYIGKKEMKFHLIVYKETKIVHTLFPHSKELNRTKKNVLNYKQGKLEVEHKIFRNLLIAKLPYYNSDFTIRYVVIIKLNNNTGVRQIWIETTTLNGSPMYCEKVQETSDNPAIDGERFLRGLEYADYSRIEKSIKQFDSFLKKSETEGS